MTRARWLAAALLAAACSDEASRPQILATDVLVTDADRPAPDVVDAGVDAPRDVFTCADATTQCGSDCVDLARDTHHCGDCATDCAALPSVDAATVRCEMGACVIAATGGCAPGRGDCDGAPSNGCEADLGRADRCGSCRARCLEPTPECARDAMGAYACAAACPTGQQRCSDGASYACVDVMTSAGHCGACETVCRSGPGATPSCAGGRCGVTCAAGFADCDANATNGCEADLRRAAAHCGACGRACAGGDHATAACVAGSCAIACAAGFADCDANATNGCEADLNGDADHCRACGNRCPRGDHAAAVCALGACRAPRCDTGYADCDGDLGNGCEVSTQDDTHHCGACGAACPAGPDGRATCVGGRCGLACATGTGNCDGVTANGCEVDVTTTLDHCGGCGMACPTRANADRTCRAGACGYTCRPGYADCDGAAGNGCEVDLNADADHCGRCDRRCLACVAGTCVT